MKWKHLDPAIGVWYSGIFMNVTKAGNGAVWTDKKVDTTTGKSVRYWIELDTGEFVSVFGNKMMNQELRGINPGDSIIFRYHGKVQTGQVDKRGIPYEKHITEAMYHPPEELEEPTADTTNEPESEVTS